MRVFRPKSDCPSRGAVAGQLFRGAFAVTFALLLLSSTPVRWLHGNPTAETWCRDLAGLGHFLGFFALTALALTTRWSTPRWAVLAGLIALGGLSELWQMALPDRVADPVDFLLNLAGIVAAAALCRWIPRGNASRPVAGPVAPQVDPMPSRRRAA